MEATAEWAQHHVYSRMQVRRKYDQPRAFLQGTPFLPDEPPGIHTPLDRWTEYSPALKANHQYGAYLWPFFLWHRYGDEVIQKSWANTTTYGSLEAIDQAILSVSADGVTAAGTRTTSSGSTSQTWQWSLSAQRE